MIFVFLCLAISLSMIISRSIYVVANDIISFFLHENLTNILLYIYTMPSLFIHLLMDI